ncbi:MAG: ribonuclease J [Oligoflexia bacterium]|nr:ribonuclease J [Oligoflexia bacterium]
MSAQETLKVIPLGGLGEIGMNCMILEYADEMIVVDCGLIFSDLDHFGVEFGIPDFNYIRDRQDKLKAFVITHGHEDHVGALPFAIRAGLNVPIYASNFASLLIQERFREQGLLDTSEIRPFKMGQRIEFKHFKISTVSVNHSIVDSAALIIDTPVGKIIHTGDFKMDPTPFIGEEIDLKAFGRAGEEGVLLLMSDSTNVERHEHSMSESVIYQAFERLFAAAEGMTIVSMFASNVGRMAQVFDLARRLGKKVALAGRTMDQNVRLGAQVGYVRGVEDVLIGLDQVDDYPRNRVIVLSTGSQGEYRSALLRISNGEHGQIKLQQGDLVVMSSKFIPGNEKAIGRMINNLFKQGAEVLYEAVHDIHVSGHATRPELRRMLELVKPRFFVPIHGEYRHLVHHSALARETGMPPENVLLAINGDVIELTPDSCRITEHMEESRILIEGREGNDISKLVLKERRQIGETGIVFALMVRNAETRRILSGPEIITKGLASEDTEAQLVAEARDVARRVILQYEDELRAGAVHIDLQENVRIELRRFFNQHIGKKPVVLPMILDL